MHTDELLFKICVFPHSSAPKINQIEARLGNRGYIFVLGGV